MGFEAEKQGELMNATFSEVYVNLNLAPKTQMSTALFISVFSQFSKEFSYIWVWNTFFDNHLDG